MIYLLDTNACIHHLKFADSPITQKLSTYLPETAVCSVTKAELFYGAMRSANPTQSMQEQQNFLELFVSLAFDDEAARICGRIRAQLANQGTPIGPYDLQIAAIALTHDLTVVTHNVREFNRVQDLKIEDWQAE
jgi:tRNA(fMet)-specific endonuclease VapC